MMRGKGAGFDDRREKRQLPRSQHPPALAVAGLVASLLVTGGVVSLVCGPPVHPLRSWSAIALLAAGYVGLAFLVHSAVVWAVCRVLGARERAGALAMELWSWVAWLPLLAMLTGERSIWVALVLPGMAASATIYAKRRSVPAEPLPEPLAEVPPLKFLEVRSEPGFLLTLLPMLATSVLLQTSAVLLGARSDWLGAMLLAAASVVPAWRISRHRDGAAMRRGIWRQPAWNSVAVLLLLAFVLLPFLKSMRAAPEVDALLHRASPGPAPPVVHAKARNDARGFSGIVLLLPAKPRERTLLPPPSPPQAGAPRRPIVIPFDGAYWYLKDPEDRPEPDARIVHGDPLKAHVHSTNMLPVLMKAHQTLPAPMKLSCCSSLQVELVNAETQAGPIYVEVRLGRAGDSDGPGTSLGRLLLASSQTGTGHTPVHETLTFALPHTRGGELFDDITVNILPNGQRALTGSQVSVQGFVLLP